MVDLIVAPGFPVIYCTHKLWANRYAQASTASEQKKIVRERGVKFSVLSDLPNFDIIRCHAVDPMHNIFLGI